jgi:hypothetical protein
MRFAGSKSDTSVILPSCEQQRKISAFTIRNVYKLRHVITSNQHPTHFIWVQNLIISKNHDADMILHRPELEQDIHAAPTSAQQSPAFPEFSYQAISVGESAVFLFHFSLSL